MRRLAPARREPGADRGAGPPGGGAGHGGEAGAGSEVLELPCGHFHIYTGEMFERSVAAQVAFLEKVMRV